MDKKNILPVKSDVIFRLFFADERNVEFLVSFLKSALICRRTTTARLRLPTRICYGSILRTNWES
jgi:hypothetical protein